MNTERIAYSNEIFRKKELKIDRIKILSGLNLEDDLIKISDLTPHQRLTQRFIHADQVLSPDEIRVGLIYSPYHGHRQSRDIKVTSMPYQGKDAGLSGGLWVDVLNRGQKSRISLGDAGVVPYRTGDGGQFWNETNWLKITDPTLVVSHLPVDQITAVDILRLVNSERDALQSGDKTMDPGEIVDGVLLDQVRQLDEWGRICAIRYFERVHDRLSQQIQPGTQLSLAQLRTYLYNPAGLNRFIAAEKALFVLTHPLSPQG